MEKLGCPNAENRRHDGIDANHIASVFVIADKMPANVIIPKWQEITVGAICTFDSLLITDASSPFVYANRLVTTLVRCFAIPSTSEHIFSSTE